MEVQLMLVKCPECELQVSDKAPACPHCGYPMKPSVKRKPRAKNNKRRRLPNGFGQISEIKNRNLRNPFRAMVTVGKTQDGKPICKPLKPDSYFATTMTPMQRLWNITRTLTTSAPRSQSKSFTISGRKSISRRSNRMAVHEPLPQLGSIARLSTICECWMSVPVM